MMKYSVDGVWCRSVFGWIDGGMDDGWTDRWMDRAGGKATDSTSCQAFFFLNRSIFVHMDTLYLHNIIVQFKIEKHRKNKTK